MIDIDQLADAIKQGGHSYLSAAQMIYEASTEADVDISAIASELGKRGVHWSAGTISKWKTIFEGWCVRHHISPGDLAGLDWTKLYTVARFLRDHPEADGDEWLEKVQQMPLADLRAELAEAPLSDPLEPRSLPGSVWQKIEALASRVERELGLSRPPSTAVVVELGLELLDRIDPETLRALYQGES